MINSVIHSPSCRFAFHALRALRARFRQVFWVRTAQCRLNSPANQMLCGRTGDPARKLSQSGMRDIKEILRVTRDASPSAAESRYDYKPQTVWQLYPDGRWHVSDKGEVWSNSDKQSDYCAVDEWASFEPGLTARVLMSVCAALSVRVSAIIKTVQERHNIIRIRCRCIIALLSKCLPS